MTKLEELIIAKAEEMVRFYNKFDNLTKEEAKKNGAEILDNHNLLRQAIVNLIEFAVAMIVIIVLCSINDQTLDNLFR